MDAAAPDAHDWQFVSRLLAAGEPWAATTRPTLNYNTETCSQPEFLRARAAAIAAVTRSPGSVPRHVRKCASVTIRRIMKQRHAAIWPTARAANAQETSAHLVRK